MFRRFNRVLLGALVANIPFSSLAEPIKQKNAIFSRRGELLATNYSQDELLKQIAFDCKEHEHLNIYDTEAHRVLLTSVFNKCELLTKNRFVNRNGAHSRMVQGPKGVGKSTVFETYTKLCANYFPEIIPIYITLDDLNSKDSDSEMVDQTIMECICRKITSAGLKVDSPSTKEYMGHRIVRSLEAANKYILLIVDEMEEIYRTPDNCPQRQNRLYMLGDLNWLGNQKTGRFAVYLCGSSSSCPLLVTCHGSRAEFPLLSGAPHLNGTKYNTLRLPVSPFTDLDAIESIVNGYFNISSLSIDQVTDTCFHKKELLRLVAFGVGVIPRSVDALCAKLEEGESRLFCSLRAEAHLSGARWYHDTSIPLYRKLMDRLREKNEGVRKMLSGPDSKEMGLVDMDLVRTVPWEKEFVSLTYEDIFYIWNRLCEEEESLKVFRADVEKLQFSILELCDKGLLTYTDIQGGMPVGLYPLCPAQVFIDLQPSATFTHFANTYDIQLTNVFKKVGWKVIDKVIEKHSP